MGRPTAVKLGPFTGGINTASDASAIQDPELVDCLNFELDLDGSLISRPPIVEITSNVAFSERIVIIGKANIAGDFYLIGSCSDGTYYFDGISWNLIVAGLISKCAVQFQDLVFIVPANNSGVDGGYWDGSLFTTDANMPAGEAAVFHKSRMWIVPGKNATGDAAHQVRFTDPISIATPTPLVWTASNLIPVGQGDGQNLVDIVSFNDNLTLFKQDSTYVFAYDLLPTDGILRQINNNIGASEYRCVVSYENSLFVFHEGSVYEIQNYDFQSVSEQLRFELDDATPGFVRTEPVFLCLFGERLLLRYYNRLYVYGLRTKTWSRWSSASDNLNSIGPLTEMPSLAIAQDDTEYYAGSSNNTLNSVFRINDGYSADIVEEDSTGLFDITCFILTKNFDFGESHLYKKLAYWGADVLSNNNTITGVVSPVAAPQAVTWDALSGYTWDELSSYTWESLITPNAVVQTDASDNSILIRKFVKFLKALRFRQINFKVVLTTDGGTTEGPCRLFSVTAFVGLKQTVVKQVT